MKLKYKTPFIFIAPIIISFYILYIIGFWNIPLPYVDLIAFSHVNCLSVVQLSQGHDYYATQFSYILPHFLYRIITVWGIDVIGSSLIVYCIMLSLFFCFVQLILSEYNILSLNKIALALIIGLLLQGLGLMVWGGPLFFSMGIGFALVSYSLICIHDINKIKAIIAGISAVFAVMCHPFMLPIICLLFLSNAFFISRTQKFQAIIIIFISALVALTAAKDFSNFYGIQVKLTSSVFLNLSLLDIIQKFYQCINFQIETSFFLLGEYILLQYIISFSSGFIIFIGVLLSLYCIFSTIIKTKKYQNTNFKISVSTCVFFGYYLLSPESPFGISMWPQRILVCILPLAALSIALFIIENTRDKLKTGPWASFLPFFMTLIIMCLYFNSLLEISSEYKKDVSDLEQKILDAGFRNTYLYFDQLNIEPFWKRSVPFALFTSHKIREKNIYFITEWHLHPQHNIRSTYKLNDLPLVCVGVQKLKGKPWLLFNH